MAALGVNVLVGEIMLIKISRCQFGSHYENEIGPKNDKLLPWRTTLSKILTKLVKLSYSERNYIQLQGKLL
jgi:hypothetical protein